MRFILKRKIYSEPEVEEIPMTEGNIEKYKDTSNLLEYVSFTPGVTEGIMLITKSDELIGYCCWENGWLTHIEVVDKFRRHGYGDYLTKVAISHGVSGLTTNDENPGLNMFKRNGFEETDIRIGNRFNMKKNEL